jgi:hypothetical protein
MYTGENGSMRDGKPEQKFDVAFRTICKISLFKEANRKFITVYLFDKAV